MAIEAIALARGAPLIRAVEADASGFALGLAGGHQRANAAVALHVMRVIDAHGLAVTPAAVIEGLAHPNWPGRLDTRVLPGGRELLLDAAHNPAGAAALASYLENAPGEPRPLVFAAMRDKSIAEMLAALLPSVSGLVATRASNPRSADPVELAALARTIAPALPVDVEPDVGEALARAWRQSPRIVVAGSIFLIGDVLKTIGGT
jgi:dihydrofolate synthase/folylpolyglutamate synthase